MKKDKSSTIHELQGLMNGLKSEIKKLEIELDSVPEGVDIASAEQWQYQMKIEAPLLRMVRTIEKTLPSVGGFSKIKIK